MVDGELIHTDFETIERENQTYRISTEIRFINGQYRCSAILWKSSNGKVRGKPLYKKTHQANKESAEDKLGECIEACSDYMDEVEEARSLDVNVNIS